jgi:hypothetical protein
MLVFWKKNEREERDIRKREQKEAHDRAKLEEEKREAARQARKLEFLISQTELYSHFVGSKLKSRWFLVGDVHINHRASQLPRWRVMSRAPLCRPLPTLVKLTLLYSRTLTSTMARSFATVFLLF